MSYATTAARILYSRSLYLQPGAETREVSDLILVKQNGVLEVFSNDGELHYGNLREDATDDECLTLRQAFYRGMSAGEDIGRAKFQREIAKLLGLRPD